MPLLGYFAWVGGVLLCLMFALNLFLPKQAPRAEYDIDKTTIRIEARGPEFSIPYAPDESRTLPVPETRPASTTQALAKYEPERKARPRQKRPIEAAQSGSENARVAEQAAPSGWGHGGWSGNWNGNNNSWGNNGWSWSSNNNWSGHWR